ncbi:MAG: hypothetical protein JW863_21050 [Chitinispirillaceae bacterium]|nr:hypothetical protein [Chitinispirillaceae bacterium]
MAKGKKGSHGRIEMSTRCLGLDTLTHTSPQPDALDIRSVFPPSLIE